jgi:hypothetical protein
VALAALICAYHDAPDAPGGLRATLPLAGRTLIERQARLAAQAGASPIIVLVERVPHELAAVIDRLRSEGVAAAIARTAADAARAIAREDRLLVIADGSVADGAHVARLLSIRGPALLTVSDGLFDERFERIDAEARWAGLAVLDGAALHQTAAMLRDWDLQSTLLRHAVQFGARQLAIRVDGAEAPVVIAEKQEDLLAAQSRIMDGSAGEREDWVSRYLLGPVEASATRALMPSPLTPAWLYVGAGVMTGLAAVLFAGGWLWMGGLAMLLATPLDGIAKRLAALRLGASGEAELPARLLPFLAGGALLSLSYHLAGTRGWGCLVLAVSAIAFLWALSGELGRRRTPDRFFLAERKGMTWLMLPFAAAGAWVVGLGALALYAAGSFFWAQHEAHRPRRAGQQD